MARSIYRGFSTASWSKRKTFTLADADLVKQDLLNHIYTDRGSRVMMPDFGTRIPTLAFEPNDETTRKIIEEDLTYVFNYDPRVRLLNLSVVTLPDNNAIMAVADILYVEFNTEERLNIEFPST